MATIPSATQIKRSIPDGEQRVVQLDTSSAGKGLQYLGQAVKGMSQDMKEVEMVERKRATNKADLTMSIALEKEGNAYDQDPDHATFGDRFDESVESAMGIAGEGLDERDRELWRDRQQLKIAQSRTRVGKVAWVKKRDEERALITQQMEMARESALTGDMGALDGDISNVLDAAVEGDYLTAQESQQMQSKWRESAATGRLEMMEPDDRIKALAMPWAKKLPADTRIRLQRDAETKMVKTKAWAEVDTVNSGELTSREKHQQVDQIKDPDVRAAAEVILRAEESSESTLTNEEQSDIFNRMDLNIRDGQTILEQDRDDWQKLEPSQRSNLEAMTSTTNRTVNDDSVYNAASSLAARGQWGELNKLLNTHGSGLKATTRDSFREAANNGIAPVDVEYNKLIDSAIPGTSMTDKRNKMKVVIADWRDRYRAAREREPTQAEAQAEVNRMLTISPSTGDDWVPFNDTPLYESDQQTRTTDLLNMREGELRAVNEEAYLKARDAVTRDGRINRYELEAEFERQQRLQTYTDRTSADDLQLMSDLEEHFSTRTDVTSSEFINAYETLRAKRAQR
jgi:hypothetical protein